MFGHVVRGHRRRLGWTQEDLAGKTGLSVAAIRRIEAGRVAAPRPSTVGLLAEAFELTDADRGEFYTVAAGEQPTGGTVPAQLPAGVRAFTGRRAELMALDRLLDTPRPTAAAVVVSAVAGTAGVGKTALAVHWAHRVTDRFPDGQLYVNLRGYDQDQPVPPGDALAGFLGALGVPSRHIPADLEGRAARYRTETSGRRILVVLDNANSAEQVRPLLPGSPTCMVVVTSRDSLAGLVALDGAHRLELDLLAPHDAISLLHRLIGARVRAEPDAAATLVARCARLPLALRIAAELAAARQTAPLSDLVAELTGEQGLDQLDVGGDPRAAVSSVFSWSYGYLPTGAARLFRLLSLHPHAGFDGYAAAALTGTGLDDAEHQLDRLARAHLIQPTAEGRYGMHDLLRAYASRQARDHDSAAARRRAVTRLLDYYLANAATATDTLHPAERGRHPRIAPPDMSCPPLADRASALAWLDTERPTLVAVCAHAATHGWPRHAIRLAATLYRYLDGGHYVDGLAVHAHAVDAAAGVEDKAGTARALTNLGITCWRLGRFDAASDHLHQALTLCRQLGDQAAEARVLGSLGNLHERLGRHGQAADHHRQALMLFQKLGDLVGEARAQDNIGITLKCMGSEEQATGHHLHALALFQRLGDQVGEARSHNNLGLALTKLGRHDEAADHHRQALTLYRELGVRSGEAHALNGLGHTETGLGRHREATGRYRQALALFQQIGERYGQAMALNGLGEVAAAAGRYTQAQAHHAAALAIATAIGSRDEQARANAGLGSR